MKLLHDKVDFVLTQTDFQEKEDKLKKMVELIKETPYDVYGTSDDHMILSDAMEFLHNVFWKAEVSEGTEIFITAPLFYYAGVLAMHSEFDKAKVLLKASFYFEEMEYNVENFYAYMLLAIESCEEDENFWKQFVNDCYIAEEKPKKETIEEKIEEETIEEKIEEETIGE